MRTEASDLIRARSIIAALRSFARAPAAGPACCNVCGRPVGPDHDHLLDTARPKLLCACPACADDPVSAGRTVRRIPRVVWPLAGFRIGEGKPVNLFDLMGDPATLKENRAPGHFGGVSGEDRDRGHMSKRRQSILSR